MMRKNYRFVPVFFLGLLLQVSVASAKTTGLAQDRFCATLFSHDDGSEKKAPEILPTDLPELQIIEISQKVPEKNILPPPPPSQVNIRWPGLWQRKTNKSPQAN